MEPFWSMQHVLSMQFFLQSVVEPERSGAERWISEPCVAYSSTPLASLEATDPWILLILQIRWSLRQPHHEADPADQHPIANRLTANHQVFNLKFQQMFVLDAFWLAWYDLQAAIPSACPGVQRTFLQTVFFWNCYGHGMVEAQLFLITFHPLKTPMVPRQSTSSSPTVVIPLHMMQAFCLLILFLLAFSEWD